MKSADLTLICSVSSAPDGDGLIVAVSDYDLFEHGDMLRARRSEMRTIKIGKKQMGILNRAHAIIMGEDIKKEKKPKYPSKKK